MMHLPLHPTLSKLVIWGAMFKCLDPILTIAATLDGNNDPFELVIEDEKRQNLHGIRSQNVFFFKSLCHNMVLKVLFIKVENVLKGT